MPPITNNYNRLGLCCGSLSAHVGYNLLGERAARSYSTGTTVTTFTVTGNAASFILSRKLTATAGVFNVTGNDADILVSRLLTASSGSFTITGNDASFLVARLLTAETGTIEVTGYDASFLVSRKLNPETGVFEVIGYDTDFTIIPAPPSNEQPPSGGLPGVWLHRRLQEEEDSLARIKEQNEIVLLLCQAVAAEEQLWAA